jgi:hypothetical protein
MPVPYRSILLASLLFASPGAALAQESGSTLQSDDSLARELEAAAAQEAEGKEPEAPATVEPATPTDAGPPAPPVKSTMTVRPETFSLAPKARPADVRSLDAIVTALYEIVSGDAGADRDWGRFRTLFYPGARMIPTGPHHKTGKVGGVVASPNDYIKANEAFLKEGFHQIELLRHVDNFGVLTHVFSWFEAREKASDAKPFMRGVNSIQLLNDGNRWWILSMAWTPETPTNPLPKEVTDRTGR